MTNTEPTALDALDRTYLDPVDPDGNCPGFKLWRAVATDGVAYLVAADYPGAVQVRIYMRSNGAVDVEIPDITYLGENPGRREWEALNPAWRR